jgi:hypothetical protein
MSPLLYAIEYWSVITEVYKIAVLSISFYVCVKWKTYRLLVEGVSNGM